MNFDEAAEIAFAPSLRRWGRATTSNLCGCEVLGNNPGVVTEIPEFATLARLTGIPLEAIAERIDRFMQRKKLGRCATRGGRIAIGGQSGCYLLGTFLEAVRQPDSDFDGRSSGVTVEDCSDCV